MSPEFRPLARKRCRHLACSNLSVVSSHFGMFDKKSKLRFAVHNDRGGGDLLSDGWVTYDQAQHTSRSMDEWLLWSGKKSRPEYRRHCAVSVLYNCSTGLPAFDKHTSG